jgi:hypothetical protein
MGFVPEDILKILLAILIGGKLASSATVATKLPGSRP